MELVIEEYRLKDDIYVIDMEMEVVLGCQWLHAIDKNKTSNQTMEISF